MDNKKKGGLLQLIHAACMYCVFYVEFETKGYNEGSAAKGNLVQIYRGIQESRLKSFDLPPQTTGIQEESRNPIHFVRS